MPCISCMHTCHAHGVCINACMLVSLKPSSSHVQRAGIYSCSSMGKPLRGSTFGWQDVSLHPVQAQVNQESLGSIEHARHLPDIGDLSRNYIAIGMAVKFLGLRPSLKQYEQAIQQFWSMTLPRGLEVCSCRAALVNCLHVCMLHACMGARTQVAHECPGN